MQKKLTITLDKRVYEGLHAVIGRGQISRFIETLVRPHVMGKDLESAYRQMARDEVRESEAIEWAEATVEDVGVYLSVDGRTDTDLLSHKSNL